MSHDAQKHRYSTISRTLRAPLCLLTFAAALFLAPAPAANAAAPPITAQSLLNAYGPQLPANVTAALGKAGAPSIGNALSGAKLSVARSALQGHANGRRGAASGVSMPDIPLTRSPKKLSTALEIVLLLSVLTLAPSILLMTTSFTRIVIVFSLLRQALGTAQLPPNQVLIGLALFMTFLVMGPTWQRINTQALEPYRAGTISQAVAFDRATGAMRVFMIRQIVDAHDEADIYMFNAYATRTSTPPTRWGQVATTVIIPAFILSELKVAFLMGFRIYLPFLIIDMVVSSVLISLGMQLLPPVLVSLPFKLLLFVLVDGWHLVTATLLHSFGT